MECVQKGVAGVGDKDLAVDAVALGVSLGQACHSVPAAADDSKPCRSRFFSAHRS